MIRSTLRVLGEEAAALGQRHGMGIDLAHVLARRARHRDEIVDNAQAHLAHNVQIVGQQQVEVLVDGTCQRVLNRHQAVIRAPAGDAFKDGGKSLARQHADSPAQKLVRGFLAKRASFALEGDQ